MAAMYWVTFETPVGQETVSVNSPDARSFKKADLRTAYRKAREKAEAKLAKQGLKGRVLAVRCVG